MWSIKRGGRLQAAGKLRDETNSGLQYVRIVRKCCCTPATKIRSGSSRGGSRTRWRATSHWEVTLDRVGQDNDKQATLQGTKYTYLTLNLLQNGCSTDAVSQGGRQYKKDDGQSAALPHPSRWLNRPCRRILDARGQYRYFPHRYQNKLAKKKENSPTREFSTDDSKEAYFRGRKLKGKTLPLPEGYRGLVLERTADELAKETQPPSDGDEHNDEDDDVVAMETVGTMQTTGEFDEMVIWSHESMASAGADPYVRSVEEWLQVSEKARQGNHTPVTHL